MILAALGIRSSQPTLAKAAKTNKKIGTSPSNLVKVLRQHKLPVRAGSNRTLKEIRQALRAGEIVIICYTEPILEWGHYALVRSITEKHIHLLDSDARTGKTTLLLGEFKRRWHDPLFTKTVRWAAFVSAPKSPR